MGCKLFHSGAAIPNALTVWLGLAVILLNLDRFSAAPLIPVLPYVLAVIVLPSLFLLTLWAWTQRSVVQLPPAALAAVEALDETGEVDI